MLDNLFEILKFPLRIIVGLFVIMSLLLFMPNTLLKILQLYDFISEYKIFFGIVWLICVVLLLMEGILFIIRLIKPTPTDKKKCLEIINQLGELLLLPEWDLFIDNAMKGFVMEKFIYNQELFSNLLLSPVMSNKYWEIRKKMKTLDKKYRKYTEIFLLHAKNVGGITKNGYFQEVKFSPGNIIPNPKFGKNTETYEEWSDRWYRALNDYIYSLNKLIELLNKYFYNEEMFPKYFKTSKNIKNT